MVLRLLLRLILAKSLVGKQIPPRWKNLFAARSYTLMAWGVVRGLAELCNTKLKYNQTMRQRELERLAFWL